MTTQGVESCRLEERLDRAGEGFVPALAGWFKRLFLGIWDFLRGADLAAAPAGAAKGRGRSTSKAKKASTTKKLY